MRNVVLFTLFVAVSVVLVGSRYFAFPAQETTVEQKTLLSGYENAVWDWSPLERSDPAQFLDALKARGVTGIYANVSDYVDLAELPNGPDKDNKITDFNTQMKRYLSLARERGLTVDALTGSPEWGNASHRYLNGLVLQYVREFNEANPDLAFHGLQFDIEPYSQEGYNLHNSQDIYAQYLDTVESIVTDLGDAQTRSPQLASMRLGFVIPYWFDGQDEYAQKILWHGESKYLFYHVLNRINRIPNGYVVIMAYRNVAEGPDGVIEHIHNEIDFSQQYAPRVGIVVGQETSDVQPAKLTYFGKPFAGMLGEVKKIGLTFENFPNLKGFAFNNADSLLGVR